MKQIKLRTGEIIKIHSDEIVVEMCSALGCYLGKILMPKKMEKGLIKTYFESKTVNSTYLFINGKEITDGLNHNPYQGI